MQFISPQVQTLLARGIKRGVLTLRREREYGTTLGALFGVMLLVQMLIVVFFGVQGIHRLLQAQLDLRLQVQEGVTNQDVQEFMVRLKNLPIVERVSYITREQAYEQEHARNPELIRFLEEFNLENPFPDTIAVTLASLRDYDRFTTFIRQPEWAGIVDPAFLSQATTQESEVRQMLRLTETGKIIVLGFLALLAVVLLFVLIELVRRRAMLRQEEIFVERLVGAPELSILVPFTTEATILMLVSLLLSGFFTWSALFFLPELLPFVGVGTLPALWSETTAVLLTTLPLLLLLQILCTPILAFIGAILGMWRQLRGVMQLA